MSKLSGTTSVSAMMRKDATCDIWVDEVLYDPADRARKQALKYETEMKEREEYIALCFSKMSPEQSQEIKEFLKHNPYFDVLDVLEEFGIGWDIWDGMRLEPTMRWPEFDFDKSLTIPLNMQYYDRSRVLTPDFVLGPARWDATSTARSADVEVIYSAGADALPVIAVGILPKKDIGDLRIDVNFSGEVEHTILAAFKNPSGTYDEPVYVCTADDAYYTTIRLNLINGKLRGYERTASEGAALFYQHPEREFRYAYSDGTPYSTKDYKKYFEILETLQYNGPYVIINKKYPELAEFLLHGGDFNRFTAAVLEMELQRKPILGADAIYDVLCKVRALWQGASPTASSSSSKLDTASFGKVYDVNQIMLG